MHFGRRPESLRRGAVCAAHLGSAHQPAPQATLQLSLLPHRPSRPHAAASDALPLSPPPTQPELHPQRGHRARDRRLRRQPPAGLRTRRSQAVAPGCRHAPRSTPCRGRMAASTSPGGPGVAHLARARRAGLRTPARTPLANPRGHGRRARPQVPPPPLDHINQAITETLDTLDGRLIVSMPPQEGKSTLTTKWTPVWHLQDRPDARIVVASSVGRRRAGATQRGRERWWTARSSRTPSGGSAGCALDAVLGTGPALTKTHSPSSVVVGQVGLEPTTDGL